MKRDLGITLAVLAVASLLTGGAGAALDPLDATKRISSCSTNPSLLITSFSPVDVTVSAVALFNSSLITSSVNVLDVTDGTPSLLGVLAPAGITPIGQLFQGVVQVDASSVGTLQLQCSAAYQGDPRRATRIASVSVVPPGATAMASPLGDASGDGGVDGVATAGTPIPALSPDGAALLALSFVAGAVARMGRRELGAPIRT